MGRIRIISLLLLIISSLSLSKCQHPRLRVYSIRSGQLNKLRSIEKPYILYLKTSKGELLYYGTYHTVNQKCPTLNDIEERWEKFNPTMLLVEGSASSRINKSRVDAIRYLGEQGLVRYFAMRDNVAIKSLEPPKTIELWHLLNYFSVEKIKIYYILRQAVINRILRRDQSDSDFVTDILRGLAKHKIFKHDLRTREEFIYRVKEFFPEVEEWQKIPLIFFNHDAHEGWLSRIHKEVNQLRDKHMVSFIANQLERGGKIFAIVGKNHVLAQEPFLRAFLNSRRMMVK